MGPVTAPLLTYMFSLPLYAVWVAGAAIVFRQRRRYPKVAGLLLLAFGLLLVSQHLSLLFNLVLPGYLFQQLLPIEQIGEVLKFGQGIFGVTTAVAWGLTIWAVFGWRARTMPA